MSRLYEADWLTKVGLGLVPGVSVVHKFGKRAVTTTLGPITESGTYQTPTTAASLEILSSSANDTSAGTGARTVTIEGLNSSWAAISQTVSMNGTSAVAIPTSMTRVHRIYVATSGTYATATSGSHAGTITVRTSGGGVTWGQVGLTGAFPVGQSRIGVYSVPTGKTAYILSKNISVDGAKTANVLFFRRDNIDDISAPYAGVMRLFEEEVGLSTPMHLAPETPRGGFSGPCDIGFMGLTGTGTTDVSVDFEILLVDD